MRLIHFLKHDLAKEVTSWVAKDIITEAQAHAICQEYDIDYKAHKQNNFLLNLLTTLGFIFIGIALIVLIGHNWDDIPRGIRLSSLLAITLITHIFAWQKYQHTGNTSLFLLGNLFYGAAIILIAQIYHLGEHMPDGVFWWALGTLPFAIITANSWLMLFTLALAIIWYILEAASGFIPFFFPLFIIFACWVLWQGKRSLLLLIACLFSFILLIDYSFEVLLEYLNNSTTSTLVYGIFNYQPFNSFAEKQIIAIAILLLLNSLADKWKQLPNIKAQDYAVFIRLWVIRFSVILLIIYSFEESWQDFLRHSFLQHSWQGLYPMLILVSIICFITCWIAYFTKTLKTVAAISLIFILPFVSWLIFTSEITQEAYAIITLSAQIFTNIIAIATAITLIIHGVSKGIREYFSLGVITLIIIAYSRYFDMIGGYIGAAILFFVFALILIGAAKFWQRQSAQTNDNNQTQVSED